MQQRLSGVEAAGLDRIVNSALPAHSSYISWGTLWHAVGQVRAVGRAALRLRASTPAAMTSSICRALQRRAVGVRAVGCAAARAERVYTCGYDIIDVQSAVALRLRLRLCALGCFSS